MTEILLVPPVAFLLYLLLVGILSGIGRVMAGTHHPSSAFKTSSYASGEAPQPFSGAPGYRPFFRVALFFAVLHLGVLVLASGGLSPVTAIYLMGLILALVALILG
jgi:NADH:ubiquinone oxidoreductase subunit 3 (subunit A)